MINDKKFAENKNRDANFHMKFDYGPPGTEHLPDSTYTIEQCQLRCFITSQHCLKDMVVLLSYIELIKECPYFEMNCTNEYILMTKYSLKYAARFITYDLVQSQLPNHLKEAQTTDPKPEFQRISTTAVRRPPNLRSM